MIYVRVLAVSTRQSEIGRPLDRVVLRVGLSVSLATFSLSVLFRWLADQKNGHIGHIGTGRTRL